MVSTQWITGSIYFSLSGFQAFRFGPSSKAKNLKIFELDRLKHVLPISYWELTKIEAFWVYSQQVFTF